MAKKAEKKDKKMNMNVLFAVLAALLVFEVGNFFYFHAQVGDKEYTRVYKGEEEKPIDTLKGRITGYEKNNLLFLHAPEIADMVFTVEYDKRPARTVITNDKGAEVYNEPGRLAGGDKTRELARLRSQKRISAGYSVDHKVETVVHRTGNTESVLKVFPGKISRDEVRLRMINDPGSENLQEVSFYYREGTIITNDAGDIREYKGNLQGENLDSVIRSLEEEGFLQSGCVITYIEDQSETVFHGPNSFIFTVKGIVSDSDKDEMINGLKLQLIYQAGYRVEYELLPHPFATRLWVASAVCIPWGLFLVSYFFYACISSFAAGKESAGEKGVRTEYSEAFKDKGGSKFFLTLDILKNSNIFVIGSILWILAVLSLWAVPETLIWIKDSGMEFLKESWWLIAIIIIALAVIVAFFIYLRYRAHMRSQQMDYDFKKETVLALIDARTQLVREGKAPAELLAAPVSEQMLLTDGRQEGKKEPEQKDGKSGNDDDVQNAEWEEKK